MKVFVSATNGDLETVRTEVKNALLDLDCHPVEEDHFGADWRKVKQSLVSKIEPCEAMIHIVGFRYGGESQNAEQPRSWTQMEYDTARELGKKVYTFVCSEGFDFDDFAEEESAEKLALQQRHRDAITSGDWQFLMVGSRDELDQRVRSLRPNIDKLRDEIDKTENEHESTRRLMIVACAVVAVISASSRHSNITCMKLARR